MAQEISGGCLLSSKIEQEALLKLLLGLPRTSLETKLLDELTDHLYGNFYREVRFYPELGWWHED